VETSVNKYKIRLTKGNKYINFPLELTFNNVNQEEIVETEFVKKETDKAINPIIDYDTIRYTPHIDNFDAGKINYNLNLLNEDGEFPELTTLGTEGFTNKDVLYRRNNFKRSFLNLMFFDSDVPTNQNYLGNITLYNRLHRTDINYKEQTEREGSTNGGSSREDGRSNMNTSSGESITTVVESVRTGRTSRTETTSTTTTSTEKSFETRCQDLKAEYDETVKDGTFIGHKCVTITGFGQNIFRFYLNGLKYGYVVQNAMWGDPIEDCNTAGEIGEMVSTIDADLNIEVPYNLFSHFRKLSTTHNYNGKTYEIFVRYEKDYIFAPYKLSEVYLRCISGGSSGESVEDYSPAENLGQIKDVSEIPLRFVVEDPVEFPRGNAEGFYMYRPKITLPESIYMRANYNNAKTGISTDLMTTPEPQNISEVLNKIHMKYNLKFDDENYYYEIDAEYSDNVTTREPLRASSRVGGSVGTITIELYEIQVL
jgi:hypothetical protein